MCCNFSWRGNNGREAHRIEEREPMIASNQRFIRFWRASGKAACSFDLRGSTNSWTLTSRSFVSLRRLVPLKECIEPIFFRSRRLSTT
ncbi:AAEL012595-PA, partial [Aedes aegypti]